ncbi:hypothetical protein F4777DRAFT_556457 [Nemania sp. FL0916]|nr:hypothetical protein F4777DRAFT_556457 [Nemania sp. FL0916]
MSLDQLHSLPPAQQEIILNGPALAPPAGVIPNLENPPNRNVFGIVFVSILLFFATSAMTTSMYVKLCHIKKLYLEDYLAFGGFGLYVAQVYSFLAAAVHSGLFVHQWNVHVKDLAQRLWYWHIGENFYAVCVVLLKSAILLEWIRVFVPRVTRSPFFWLCHILLWTNVVFYTAILIFANVACKPYAKLWDKTLPGTCIRNHSLEVATASYNLLSDFLILLLPQQRIWRLHLQLKKKIGVAVVFAIGILACVSASYRLYASINYLIRSDEVYGISAIAIGSEAEIVCAILVFYVPTIPKAFKNRKSPFRLLTSIFPRPKSFASTTGASRHKERQDGQYERIYLTETHRSDEGPQGIVAPPPHAIIRTTHIHIDEESGYEDKDENFSGIGYSVPASFNRTF